MKCLNCKVEFNSSRTTAKYCGAKCRKLAFLSVPSVEPVSVLSVPEKEVIISVPVSVPKIIKNAKDIKQIKRKMPNFPKALRMTNPEFTSRMVWGSKC